MLGLIQYSSLSELSLHDAIIAIINSSRIRFGDIKLSDLLLSGSVLDLKLADFTTPAYYGMGVYIFFDGDTPVYAGKAKSFLHRLSSHRSIDSRPEWGWNALLLKVCFKYLGIEGQPTEENLLNALSIAENFSVVRVLLDIDEVKQKLSRFERIILKGVMYKFETLLNGGVGRVNEAYMKTSINQLMQ